MLQLTPVVKKDVYLVVSGPRMNYSDTFKIQRKNFIGKVMKLSNGWKRIVSENLLMVPRIWTTIFFDS